MDASRNPSRRDFLTRSAAAGMTMMLRHSDGPDLPPFELDEVSLAQLRRELGAGKYTAQRLVELYQERIAALDKQGPGINAILEINPDASAIARQRDEERAAGRLRGPLHGIPILIKDNIATADRMETTAGSLALVGAKAPHDATVAARLVNAGAVLLGKTNLSEWANFRSTHSVSGWSGRGGQTRNPYALDRTPSGSSSGSGAAVAACLATAAVGTETDGSILSPSAACCLVGLKPTVGLVSRTGIVPISHTQDTAGPMARTVQDAALLLSAMVCADPDDPATQVPERHAHPDYTAFLDPHGLKGKRIGVPRKSFFSYSPAADQVAHETLATLKAVGATLVDPADIPTAGQLDDLEVLLYEFKTDLNRYLAWLAHSPVRSLKEVIAFNERERAREMPFFQQEIMHQAQAKGPLTAPGYLKALDKCRRLSRDQGIDAILEKHHLDAFVAPTQAPPWLIDLANGDSGAGSGF